MQSVCTNDQNITNFNYSKIFSIYEFLVKFSVIIRFTTYFIYRSTSLFNSVIIITFLKNA